VKTAALVETVDIFPTLLDLAGLDPLPVTDGLSFAPLLDDPEQPWEDAAFHVFNRSRTVDGERQAVIGHAIRTARHRYVAWQVGWEADGKLVAEDLYDYDSDPHETQNHAGDPEYTATKKELREKLLAKLARY
jgi:iduronate 2-sulfatase